MDIKNSSDVINKIKFKSIILSISIYSTIFLFTFGISIIPIVFLWIIASIIVNKEIDMAEKNGFSFNRSYPFRYFGSVFGNFAHVFHHEHNLENDIVSRIEKDLSEKTPVSRVSKIEIMDVDKNLSRYEGQIFRIAGSAPTRRGTVVTLVIRFSNFGSMQSIQWWALAGGYVNRDRKFNFISYAPFFIWFWIIPYLKKEYDLVSALRTVYGSTYNDLEVETCIRCLHDVVFNSLINEFRNNGVDTSGLEAQKMQVMNLNVSGGRVNIGNMIQGSIKKINGNSGIEVMK